jgi:hypothetical protein
MGEEPIRFLFHLDCDLESWYTCGGRFPYKICHFCLISRYIFTIWVVILAQNPVEYRFRWVLSIIVYIVAIWIRLGRSAGLEVLIFRYFEGNPIEFALIASRRCDL